MTGTNVKLDLFYKASLFPKWYYDSAIATSVPAEQGNYCWTIPASQAIDRYYRVEVKSLTYPSVSDRTDGWFKFSSAPSPATITVTSPNGGEIWQRGTSHTVTWSYTGSPGSLVKIVLFKGSTEVGTIKESTSIGSGGTGSYPWLMSTTGLTGSDFKVSVQSISQPAIKDMSNNYFTITPSQIPPPTPSTASITLTSPNGGESWQRGTSHTVTWSYTGNPGSFVKIVLLKAGAEIGTIATSAPIGSSGKGSYTWQINSAGSTGSDYKVSVQSISLARHYRHKQWLFHPRSIRQQLAPSITVTAPNGGESWKRGTSHMVNWSYTGSPGF